MGGGVFAVVVGLIVAGIGSEFILAASDPPGVLVPDRISENGVSLAKQAEAFGAACVSAAISSPGATGPIIPMMPPGVSPPLGGSCEAYAAGGGGRNVYAVVPQIPGMAAQFSRDQSPWWSVNGGWSINLITAQTQAPPAVASTGDAYEWVSVNP